MVPEALAPFILASFLIELTPGPNMTYLALVAARDGRAAGAATVAGVAVGLGAVGAACTLGIAELIRTSPALYEGLRWAGVLFLFYLAWDGWTGEDGAATEPKSRFRSSFVRGLVTNLLNPKAAIFYVAVLPTFIDASSDASRQALLLTAVYVAVATVVHAAVVVLAGAAQPLLIHPSRARIARRVLSVLLALVAVWFGVASRR